jgi:2-oxoglutarate dehydrogenase E2 component (dihydrolipoamide succinyltransferase)
MLTTFNEVDMSKILEIRKAYKDRFQEKYGIGLGFMSFFTKACAQALLEFPEVNSQLHEDELVYFNYADISIAVSTDRGLVVPVVRNAHLLSLAEIERV